MFVKSHGDHNLRPAFRGDQLWCVYIGDFSIRSITSVDVKVGSDSKSAPVLNLVAEKGGVAPLQ